MNPYEQLKAKMAEIEDLRAATSLMVWDQEVMMSNGSAETRGRQLATLNQLIHEKFVDEAGPLIEKCEAEVPETEAAARRNLAVLRYELNQRSKMPPAFVHQTALATNRAFSTWREAKPKNDFAVFQGPLGELIELKKQVATFLEYPGNPYDALLDTFEPGLTAVRVQEVFDQIKQPLIELLSEIQKRPQIDDSFLLQNIPAETQLSYTRKVLERMGYDFHFGRQDLSSHPFMISMGHTDVRVTTMVRDNDLGFALYSSVHEGGHALYELGIPSHSPGMPDSMVGSLSLHESQSRLWENNVSRGLPFWESQFVDFKHCFPGQLAGKSAFDVFRAYNKVEPSLIRIAADELTYHFHIILRFELENALFNGQLSVQDLPSAWNQKIKDYLGLDVPSDTEGVLQDIHWSHGSFGYFPTYSLGSLYAAQFHAKAIESVPNLEDAFRRGDFSPMRDWLSQNIWSKGNQYTAETLCELATGEPLNVNYFVSYARNKFGAAYGLNS